MKAYWVILIVAGILGAQAVWGIAVYYSLPCWQDRGTFGDMFGGVNVLFSGLALAGVVVALFLQRQELKLQREELKLTRQELQKTARAQQGSQRALNKSGNGVDVDSAAERQDRSCKPLHYWDLIRQEKPQQANRTKGSLLGVFHSYIFPLSG